MSKYQNINDIAIGRRAETVVTQQPGYASTEQVTRDVAAERRLQGFQINLIMVALLGISVYGSHGYPLDARTDSQRGQTMKQTAEPENKFAEDKLA